MMLTMRSVNDDGITPVHQAASEGHVQCLKLLLEVGANIDGRDCRGNTPLDLAKLWAHRKCARYAYIIHVYKIRIWSCLSFVFVRHHPLHVKKHTKYWIWPTQRFSQIQCSPFCRCAFIILCPSVPLPVSLSVSLRLFSSVCLRLPFPLSVFVSLFLCLSFTRSLSHFLSYIHRLN